MRRLRASRRFESVAALAACTVAAVLVSRNLLRPDVFSDDAFVHQHWMWHWRDPQLFTDSLTADLRESSRYPDGYQGLFWLATHVASPIAFGEWLGVALMAVSGWLAFLIVREHTDWRPAAWIAGALFLALIDIHRFHGGFPRAFMHPVVLLAVLIVSTVRWTGARPQLDRRRAGFALLAAGLALAALLGPQVASGGSPRVFTADEARMFPEFGPHGTLHFFLPSTLDYLRQNRSGFDLLTAGSVLALAALALLAAPVALAAVAVHGFPLGPPRPLDELASGATGRHGRRRGRGRGRRGGRTAARSRARLDAARGWSGADRRHVARRAGRELGPLGARRGLSDGTVGALPRRPAEGCGHRRRPVRPEVPAGNGAARGGDLDAAGARLRGRPLLEGPRAGVRHAARLPRPFRRRDRRAGEPLRRHASVGAPCGGAQGARPGWRPLAPPPAAVRPVRQGARARGRARRPPPPAPRRRWRHGSDEVYDIACLSASAS